MTTPSISPEVKGLDLLLEALNAQQDLSGVRAEIQLVCLHRVIEHAEQAAIRRVEREMQEMRKGICQ